VVSPLAVHKAYERLRSSGLCRGSADGGYQITPQALDSDRNENLALALLERELLAQEIQSAREVQKRLLPPSEVVGDSWHVSARSFPAGVLAGDFYDVVETGDGRIGVTVADVAGKGLAAGLIMAVVKSLLPDITARRSSAAALQELDQRLGPLLSRREFVALIHARFDPTDGALELVNAGLPDPYLVKIDGSMQTLSVEGARLPLGTGLDVPYSLLRTRLDVGDRLLLITDGIPEATDRHGEPIGYRGVSRILQAALQTEQRHPTKDRAPDHLLDFLFDRASALSGSILEDDWTALLLQHRNS